MEIVRLLHLLNVWLLGEGIELLRLLLVLVLVLLLTVHGRLG